MKTTFRFPIRKLIISLVGLASCTLAYAFTVFSMSIPTPVGNIPLGGSTPNHESITLGSLLSQFSTNIKGENYSFFWKTANLVVDNVRQTDSTYWNTDYIHFDNESFSAANGHLALTRTRIAQLAIAKDYYEAQMLLGMALHTIQDFYSHSTWIETHPVVEPPLATLGKEMLTGLSPGNLPCTVSGLRANQPLTTGFFFETQALVSPYYVYQNSQVIRDDQGNAIQGKCSHGTSKRPNSDSLGKGINKDNDLRENFGSAYNTAIRATTQFVTDVIGEIRARNGTDNNICGLLGQDSGKCTPPEPGKLKPGWVCPSLVKGLEENPDSNSSVSWNVTFDFDTCANNNFSGNLVETRYLNGRTEKQVRYFSGFFDTDGSLIVNIGDAVVNTAPELTPCRNVRATFNAQGEQLKGSWTSSNCRLGGAIVASLSKDL